MRDGSPGITAPLQWDFFGGGVEDGEDVLHGAAREMEEELGLRVTPDQFTSLGSLDRNATEEYLLRFHGTLEWGDFRVFEGAGAAFFTIEEMQRIDLGDAATLLMQHFLLPVTRR
jgi:8-oxo-dGTP pyrophosphatase MutT (NUDIX family)